MRSLISLFGLFIFTADVCAQRILPTGQGVEQGLGVWDMTVFENELIIAGYFQRFNSHERRNIQGWTGTSSNDLPGAFTAAANTVRALELFQGALVAAGTEPAFNNIAQWDGSQWLPLGEGLPARVEDLVNYNDFLVACGDFDGVYAWSGTQWQLIGDPAIGPINTLAVYNGLLYAGGSSAPYLHHLGQDQWQPTLGGLNGEVNDIFANSSALYIGGAFTNTASGDLARPYFCRFDGTYTDVPGSSVIAEVTNIVGLGPQDIIVSQDLEYPGSFLLRGSKMIELSLPLIRACFDYSGQTYIGGMGQVESYQTVRSFGRFSEGVDHAYLDINGIRARVEPSAAFFRQNAIPQAGFEAPKGSGLSPLYCVNPWFASFSSDSLFTQRPIYQTDDLKAGPVGPDQGATYGDRYFQVWKLDKEQIQFHRLHYGDAGYVPILAIQTWPGNGELLNSEPTRLAPFEDLNGNGFYEPSQGEYPLIRGDQAIYHILHDNYSTSAGYAGPNLELHVMHYAFHNTWDAYLGNTVFTNLKWINRSVRTFEDPSVGIFADWDIGNFNDDLSGCDTMRNMFFAYNRLPFDSTSTISLGYADRPPAIGALMLNQRMTSHVSFIRDGPWALSTPDAPLSFYFVLNGQRSNGSAILDPDEIATPFEYYGDPSILEAWTAGSSTPIPADISSAAGVRIAAFLPSDTICLDVAFVFAQDTMNGPLASVSLLKQYASELIDWYGTSQINCNGSYGIATDVPDLSNGLLDMNVFPNPSSDRIAFSMDMSGSYTFQLFNLTGQMVRSAAGYGNTGIVDISTLDDGLYVLRVFSSGNVHQRQVVVQR